MLFTLCLKSRNCVVFSVSSEEHKVGRESPHPATNSIKIISMNTTPSEGYIGFNRLLLLN